MPDVIAIDNSVIEVIAVENNSATDVIDSVTNVIQIVSVAEQGAAGAKGDDGLSAYQVAVNNGFVGTEQQWLDSLSNSSLNVGYTHTQTSASSLWTINHNLGIKPSIYIYSDGGLKIEGDVLPTSSLNQVQIAFTLPVSGGARLI